MTVSDTVMQIDSLVLYEQKTTTKEEEEKMVTLKMSTAFSRKECPLKISIIFFTFCVFGSWFKILAANISDFFPLIFFGLQNITIVHSSLKKHALTEGLLRILVLLVK